MSDPDGARVSAATVATHTPTDRNRAVDLYRAAAMAIVAVGHWLVMVAVLDDGELAGGNLLDFAPEYGWITWIGQVMPLFFFVGGFASATSLRSAERKGVRPADWIATRLHRMVTPAAALAGFWAVALLVGAAVGGFGVVSLGAAGAAIPLWFLANYTIDTALAPFTFRWFRSRPRLVVGALVVLFGVAEAARFAGIPVVPQANWVIGWLGFQIAGFAWQDGRLPTGRALTALAATFWALALAAVNLGPWPAVMLHHGGLEHSPTHPPSTALILFGLAYSFTAAALAPSVTRWLERSTRGWQLTIAANAVAMSVYLWHMTAAVLVAGVAYAVDLIPTVEPGTTAWWWTKIPFLLLNLAVLVPVVRRVAPIEQRALLGGTTEWRWGMRSMLVVAALLSLSVKAWSSPEIGVLIAGLVGTLCVCRLALTGHGAHRAPGRGASAPALVAGAHPAAAEGPRRRLR
ncbi:acyltransferase [Iamia sp.]|uniref:acyltransferase family protein n=1 Tax=Iamia sp. TaxID=2722710 RepID=UPI002BDD025A|nr:acyltransferase [Iamia sp.]HXH57033.1 acyltransferase [Iamia sp.]